MLKIKDIYFSEDGRTIYSRIVDDKGDMCSINDERFIFEEYNLESEAHEYKKLAEARNITLANMMNKGMSISVSQSVSVGKGIYRCRILKSDGSVLSEMTKFLGEEIKVTVEFKDCSLDGRNGILYIINSNTNLSKDVIEYTVNEKPDFRFRLSCPIKSNSKTYIFIASEKRVKFILNNNITALNNNNFSIIQ